MGVDREILLYQMKSSRLLTPMRILVWDFIFGWGRQMSDNTLRRLVSVEMHYSSISKISRPHIVP